MTRARRLSVVVVITMLASFAAPQSQAPASRFVVIASDLHLGVGRSANGDWLPIEDFR